VDAAQGHLSGVLEAARASRASWRRSTGVDHNRPQNRSRRPDQWPASKRDLAELFFEIADLHKSGSCSGAPAFTADLRPGRRATVELPQYPASNFAATLARCRNAVEAVASILSLQPRTRPAARRRHLLQLAFPVPSIPSFLRLPATACARQPRHRGSPSSDRDKALLTPVQLGRRISAHPRGDELIAAYRVI